MLRVTIALIGLSAAALAQTATTTDINGTDSPATQRPVLNNNFHSVRDTINTHTARTDNPHSVTAAQLGAGTLAGNNTWTAINDFSAARLTMPSATFASAPSSPVAGQTFKFTDASATGVCAGGGTSQALCYYTGSGWASVGGGLQDPMTTRGDLIYRGASGTTRIALGSNGQCLISNGTDAAWGACGTSSPLTTKGDLYTFTTTNARLPVGTDGQVLTADSTQATGIKWAAATGGGGGGVGGAIANHGNLSFTVPVNPTPVSMWTDTIPAIPANQCVSFTGFFIEPTNNNTTTITATYGSTTFTIVSGVGGAGVYSNGMICADATQANISVEVNAATGVGTWFSNPYNSINTYAESTSTSKSIAFKAINSGGGDTLRVDGFQMGFGGSGVSAGTTNKVAKYTSSTSVGNSGITDDGTTVSTAESVDFSGAAHTLPAKKGTVAGKPAACTVGEEYFATDATAGSNKYLCTATNTWTQQTGGGGGLADPGSNGPLKRTALNTTAIATAADIVALWTSCGGNYMKGDGTCTAGSGGLADPGSNGPLVRTALNTTAVASCSDIYKPGCAIASGDQAPNTAYTDAQNTFSDPGNQYFGKYDVVCDATDASLTADNVLVKKASTGKCVIMTTTDTDITTGFWGVLVSGHGTANGRVRRLGVASSISSTGTVNTGDWVFVSTTTNGYIQGSSTRPSSGTLVIGRANGPGPNPPVDLLIDPNSAAGSAGTEIHSRATMTADATIAASTATAIAFDSNVEDAGSVHSTSSNNTRFTVPVGQSGWYFAACQASFFENFTNSTFVDTYLQKNGVADAAHDMAHTIVNTVSAAGFPITSAAGTFHLDAGDYLECFVKQQDASSHTLDHTRTFGMLTKLNTGSGGTGGGDASTNTSTSADGEVALFSGTGGKTLKRATGTGIARLASGVQSAAELSGDATTSGSNAVTVAKVNGVNAATVFDGSVVYCADAGASDTYACNMSPALGSYVTGGRYRFKANTANTGAASINFNSLGAKTIKKAAGGITTDLNDNDIRVGQIVDVVYDGTNMQMQSTLGNAAVGGSGYSTVQGNGNSATQRATVNFVGGPISVTDVGGTTTQVSIEDPISTFYLKDNFGCGAYTSGSVGCLGWFLSASGFAAQPANSIAGSPGILTLTTSGTINSVVSISPVATSHAFATSETFQIRTKIASIAGTSPASNTTIRIGLSDATTGTVDPPANGMYLEHLAADTNWFCVVRASSTDNRVDTGVAFAATATAVQIRRVDSTHIGCKVASSLGGLSGATEASNSGTEPTGDTVPYIMIKNTAAENKLLNLNFWDFLITGLSR